MNQTQDDFLYQTVASAPMGRRKENGASLASPFNR
jgi:hypothetical protein